MYTDFKDLPNHIKTWVRELIEPDDPVTWARSKIPALEGRSLIEVMNEPDGEQVVIAYLQRARGR